ncbi:drug resistance transporter, EmrB/QacA subfamily [Desulfosporosinus acidiphilus SJ4]|uniref:Drug resistance transporter, EmrB/QacA subfamily n=1 Tax=Desulfosporosinus acidiphilus (strain DSM 22704 / JCM 16185 / SJ4) TaxID=646529 RepID=I4D6A6_DESAJ|nr:MFS transporter [Desulfosporosinus acidiphilus]AFM41330.1 drug resistance transporter, EmrB/QacA subfamily [Desulfosporosinus acidiphilus SJ4]
MDYKWKALSCTSLGALLSVLSSNTLIIALPDIMKELHASMNSIIWTVMIYMLVITILVPSIGRIADMIGRKKLFVSGFVIFTIGSLLCGFSQTAWQLILFRLIQSIGGALLLAVSTPIVADAFSRGELGKALGINGMIISVGSVIGPILGGAFVTIGWRWIFYINLPIGIIGSIWAWSQIKEVERLPQKQSFDWLGTIFFTIGMLALLVALTLGGFKGWLNLSTLVLFALALIFMVAFVQIENKIKEPMLDLSLFKTRILAFALTSNLLNGIARGAVTFLLVFYFQGIKAIDPVMAGILLSPFAVSMMIMAPISGKLSDRYGSRVLSSLGLLISALGLIGMVEIKESTSILELAIWMFIAGLGSGMFFSPNTSAIMGAVAPQRRGIAGGVRTMMNNAGSVISMALSMAIISSSITPEALQGLFAGTQVGSQGIAVAQFIGGLRTAFAISFGMSLLAAIISYMRGSESSTLVSENM